jgi:hypothetical protein
LVKCSGQGGGFVSCSPKYIIKKKIFKGTPSQKEHKTIFSGLKISKMAFLDKVTLWRYFQQSAILSVTLTLTFRYLSIPESQFSGVKPSYGARATADCRIPELMKFR